MTLIPVHDLTTLSRGWSDWILFAEVEEQLRDRGSLNIRRDSIEWAVLHRAADYARVGVILPDRIQFWDDTGAALSSRMQAWLNDAPADDPSARQ